MKKMSNKKEVFKAEKIGLFTLIDGIQAIISTNGVWKQVPVYEREGLMYAAITKVGYVSMSRSKRTSSPRISWKAIVATTNCEFSYSFGRMDWMEIEDAK